MNRYLNDNNSLKRDIFLGIITAISFSLFIYLAYFSLTCKICNTISALLGLWLLLYLPKKAVLFSGFFIGLLWFYWIGFSFKYYNLHWMEPIVIIGFGLVYMLFFGVLALTNKPYLRAILLFLLNFIHPFYFNWMKIPLLFVNSYFGIHNYDLMLVLTALSLPSLIKNRYSPLPLFLLLPALSYPHPLPKLPNIKIDLVTTHLSQNQKWKPSNLQAIVNQNFKDIKHAIDKKYNVVVLPESAFPLYMNMQPKLIKYLQFLSHKITIITGTLLYKNQKEYNVSYMFKRGKYKIAKKMVLVPFGEYVPLPKFIRKWVNKIFFGGAGSFSHAKHVTDFTINGMKFRNAICYEATTSPLFKGDPKYMIAMSNNAWFTPSIEPTLQLLLMKYYSKKYGTIIFHASNMATTGIVR